MTQPHGEEMTGQEHAKPMERDPISADPLAAPPTSVQSTTTRTARPTLSIRRRSLDPLVLLVAFSALFAVAGVSFAAGRITASPVTTNNGSGGMEAAPFGPDDGRFGPPLGFDQRRVRQLPGE
jgi:hypothetical protein